MAGIANAQPALLGLGLRRKERLGLCDLTRRHSPGIFGRPCK